MGSFVRFTSGSGYTQFGGFTTPIFSTFIISEETYKLRKKASWPEKLGTVMVPFPSVAVTPGEKKPEAKEDWDKLLREGLDS